MGKSYSLDLRERVSGFIELGHSRREAARHFEVSPSFAVKLAARVACTGSARPARQGRPPGGGKLAPYRNFLMSCVQAKSDITMPELSAALEAAHGVSAHPASLSRFLRRQGLTYKKIAAGPGERTRRRGA